MPRDIVAFLDSNVLLHYRHPKDIDWLELFGAEKVELVVAPCVVDELDEAKWSPRCSQRVQRQARKVIKWLETIGGTAARLSGAVTIVVPIDAPHPDFGKLGLNSASGDDRLLGDVITYAHSAKGGVAVIVVSGDAGVRMRAQRFRIRAVEPPEDALLPQEPDSSTKKVRALEAQIDALREPLPVLSLGFCSGGKEATLCPFASAAECQADPQSEVERAKQQHPKQSPGAVAGVLGLAATLGLAEYNQALDEYYDQCRAFAAERSAYLRSLSMWYPLRLEVHNVGGSPAKAVDVKLHFPGGFDVVEEADRPPSPAEPRAPKRGDYSGLGGLRSLGELARSFDIPVPRAMTSSNVCRPQIRKTESWEVRIHVERVPHKQDPIPLSALYVVFETEADRHPFAVRFSLIAENTPDPVDGQLLVRLEADPAPEPA